MASINIKNNSYLPISAYTEKGYDQKILNKGDEQIFKGQSLSFYGGLKDLVIVDIPKMAKKGIDKIIFIDNFDSNNKEKNVAYFDCSNNCWCDDNKVIKQVNNDNNNYFDDIRNDQNTYSHLKFWVIIFLFIFLVIISAIGYKYYKKKHL